MKKSELKSLINEVISEIMKESAPPHFPSALEKKLLNQYKSNPSKAYATMWAIHNRKNEGDNRVTEMWMAWENKGLKEVENSEVQSVVAQIDSTVFPFDDVELDEKAKQHGVRIKYLGDAKFGVQNLRSYKVLLTAPTGALDSLVDSLAEEQGIDFVDYKPGMDIKKEQEASTDNPPYKIGDNGERMFVRDDVAEAILNLPTTRFSSGSNAKNFKVGEYAYFDETTYNHRLSHSKYKAHMALKRVNFTPGETGYNFVVVAVSGSFGFGGLQQAAKYVFSKRVKDIIFDAAKKFIDQKVASKLTENENDASHDEADMDNPEEKTEVELAIEIKKLADQLLSMHGQDVHEPEDKEPSEESPEEKAPESDDGEASKETNPMEESWDKKDTVASSKKGMFKGKTKAELEKQLKALKAKGPHKKGSEGFTKMKELQFALRAKNNWGKVK